MLTQPAANRVKALSVVFLKSDFASFPMSASGHKWPFRPILPERLLPGVKRSFGITFSCAGSDFRKLLGECPLFPIAVAQIKGKLEK